MFRFRLFKRSKNNYIKAAIDSHEKTIQQTKETLDKAIAALDGESKWFTCVCYPNENNRSVMHDDSNGNSCQHSNS